MKKSLIFLLLITANIVAFSQDIKGKNQINIAITNYRPHKIGDCSDAYFGGTLNYNRLIEIYKNLGAEVGGAVRFIGTDSEPEEALLNEMNYSKFPPDKTSTGLLSFIVPVSLTFNIPLSTKVSISPLAGFNMKYNALYYTIVKDEKGMRTLYDWFNYHKNLYDFQHFIFGAQLGVRLYINRYNIGFIYEPDITKLDTKNDYKVYTFNLSFGVNI